jgi:hypothetical protein
MTALIAWLPFCATGTGAVLGGSLSDAWIPARRVGRSRSQGLLRYRTIGLGSAAALSDSKNDQLTAMSLLILASFVFGLYTANLFAVTQTLAGVVAAGKWTAIQNGRWQSGGHPSPGGDGVYR